MKTHHVLALYTLLFACAISAYFWQIRGLAWAWALLASGLWQLASLGLFLKKKWAAPFTFALFGLALAIILAFGVVQLVRGTDPTMRGSLVFLVACVALFLPLRLLSSRKVRETFGFRIHDPESENQRTENEQA
jgi:hypothetical protein